MAKETIVNEETTITPEETTIQNPDVVMAKRKRNRTTEVLETVNPKSMTESEMISYISFLRNERNTATAKITALEDNCKSAYEKVRNFNKRLSDCLTCMERAYNYAEGCVAQTLKAIKNNKIATRIELSNMLNDNKGAEN